MAYVYVVVLMNKLLHSFLFYGSGNIDSCKSIVLFDNSIMNILQHLQLNKKKKMKIKS